MFILSAPRSQAQHGRAEEQRERGGEEGGGGASAESVHRHYRQWSANN